MVSESQTVTFRWKVLATLRSEPDVRSKNIVFNISQSPNVFSQFGVPPSVAYVPLSFEPTVVFHQTLRNLLQRHYNVKVKEPKFPYTLPLALLQSEAKINLKIRLYQPKILCITVTLSPLEIPPDPSLLIKGQNFEALLPLNKLVYWTVAMSESLNHRISDSPHPQLQSKPLVHLRNVCPPEEFSNVIKTRLSEYVGVLIRNPDYSSMDHRVAERILLKNSDHNVKSSQKLILIDKQGVLQVTPCGQRRGEVDAARLPRVHDLVEIAMLAGAYLDDFQQTRSLDEDLADFFLYKIRAWIEKPEVVFHESVTNRQMWLLLSSEFSLKPRLDSVLTDRVRSALQEKSAYFDEFAVTWMEEIDFRSLLSSKVRDAREFYLSFIDNVELKQTILSDYVEARRSFLSKNYKAAIVLSGSIAEAVLTFVIEKANLPGVTREVLYQRDYQFGKLIEVAAKNGLISDPAIVSYLTPLKEYRNMIHPGMLIRNKLRADSSRAEIALLTVNLLLRELDKFRPPNP